MSSSEPGANTTTGDHGAPMLSSLFRLHGPAVFAVCLANTRNYHDAEDAMQAVFLKAVAKISRLQEPASARAWLLQVARRSCIDFHRRRKPTEPLLEEPSTLPSRVSPRCERLHEAIQKLPETYREAIVLYYMDNRSCASVAASLKTTEQAIRQRLVRARTILHDLLQEDRP